MTSQDGLDGILRDLAVRVDALEQAPVNAPRLGEETTRSIYDTLHKLLNALTDIEQRLHHIELASDRKCDGEPRRTADVSPYKNIPFNFYFNVGPFKGKHEVTADMARVGEISRTEINIIPTNPENEDGSD